MYAICSQYIVSIWKVYDTGIEHFVRRYGIIDTIVRVTIGGVLYTFLKCDWLPLPTPAQIASFQRKNSILGVDKVSKAIYTFDPWDTSNYTMDNREPFILASHVHAQVVIAKHPCMDSAVILDTSDRNMEKLALVDRPIGSDGHFDTCGKCRFGGELLLCEMAGCKEAMHARCAGLADIPKGSWYCRKCADA